MGRGSKNGVEGKEGERKDTKEEEEPKICAS